MNPISNPVVGTALELQQLHLEIAGRVLVTGLDMRVEPGQIWCVLGANGAGKTTLLRSIAGLHKPSSGKILLADRDLQAYSLPALARMRGYMPQSVHDTFSARVLDVVLTARYPHLSPWGWRGEFGHDIATAALAAVDLAGFHGRDVTTLSGGERQRVGIAMLLAQDVDTMLFDEPVASLDLHHQVMVLDHLQSVVHGSQRCIIMSLHDINLAYRYSSHCVLLDGEGQAMVGPTQQVMTGESLSRIFRHGVSLKRVDEDTFFVVDHARSTTVPSSPPVSDQHPG